MAPRKEPKEQVVYAASTRKAPPFKPQRPSQVPRIPTTESESNRASAARRPAAPAKRKPKPAKIVEESDEDEDESQDDRDKRSHSELEDDPLAARPSKPSKIFKPPAAEAKTKPARDPSPMDISSDDADAPRPQAAAVDPDRPYAPPQAEQPVMPRPLLVRLLHEHFTDPKTKIDEHAIQVLERYLDIFVQETIARARQRKEEEAAKAGNEEGVDAQWLELEDLEKVAAGMMLDF